MKKSLLCLALTAIVASTGATAQELSAGESAFRSADGSLKKPVVAAAATAGVISAALIANANGSAPARIITGPVDPICTDEETLVDGVCIANTVTTTVTNTVTGTATATATATATVTSTITVPVTTTGF